MQGREESGWASKALLFDLGRMSAPSDCGRRMPQPEMLGRWRSALFIDSSYTGSDPTASQALRLEDFFADDDDGFNGELLFRQLVMVASDDPTALDLDWSCSVPDQRAWAPDASADAPLNLLIGLLSEAMHGNSRLKSISLRFQSETGCRLAALSDEVYARFSHAIRSSNLTEISLPHPSWFDSTSISRYGLNHTAAGLAQAAYRCAELVDDCVVNKAFITWIDHNRCFQRLLVAAMSRGMTKPMMPELPGDLVSIVCEHLNASRLCPRRAEWELHSEIPVSAEWELHCSGLSVSDTSARTLFRASDDVLFCSRAFMWHSGSAADVGQKKKRKHPELVHFSELVNSFLKSS